MAPVKFSFTGLFDVATGILLYFTVSPLPAIVATAHALFLIYKGSASILPLPLGMPVFVLGSAADVISAAILLTGAPPVLAEFKVFIAAFLFFKGLMGLLAMM